MSAIKILISLKTTEIWPFLSFRHILTIIYIVKLTVHVTALLLNFFPVIESGWIPTPLRATIVNSCVTFTVCCTTAASNVPFHVSPDTVGCASVVISTGLETWPRSSTVIPITLLDLEIPTRDWVHVIVTTNGSASRFHITNTSQTGWWNGSFTKGNYNRYCYSGSENAVHGCWLRQTSSDCKYFSLL